MEGILQKRSARLTLLILFCAGFLVFAFWLRSIFAPLLLGFLIAYVLDPFADRLERMKFSRLASVCIIYSITSIVIIGLFSTCSYYAVMGLRASYGRLVSERVEGVTAAHPKAVLAERSPPAESFYFLDRNRNGVFDMGYLEKSLEYVRTSATEEDNFFAREVRKAYEQLVSYLEDFQEDGKFDYEKLFKSDFARRTLNLIMEGKFTKGSDPSAVIVKKAEEEGGIAAAIFSLVSWFGLCPLYVFFFLLNFDPMIAGLRRYLPYTHKERIERLIGEVDRILSAFFRGRLLICLAKGSLISLGLMFCGVPFWLPLGLAAGFLGLIPYIGIWFSLLPTLGLCWFEYESLWRIVAVLVVFGIMEAVEAVVLIPAFLGKEIGLHPVTILVTLLVFGQLLGFFGVLLSVPLAAITKILGREFVLPLIETFAKPHDSDLAVGQSGDGGASPKV